MGLDDTLRVPHHLGLVVRAEHLDVEDVGQRLGGIHSHALGDAHNLLFREGVLRVDEGAGLAQSALFGRELDGDRGGVGQTGLARLARPKHLGDAPGADSAPEEPVEFNRQRGDVLVVFLDVGGGRERGEIQGLARLPDELFGTIGGHPLDSRKSVWSKHCQCLGGHDPLLLQ